MGLIPTIWKKPRLPQTESWPIGAEALTAALCDTPQATTLKVRFLRLGRTRQLKEVEVICVGESAFEGGWGIIVYPIPRPHRNLIRTWLLEEGLTIVAKWLNSAAALKGRSVGRMIIWFDKENKTVYARARKARPRRFT